MKSFVTGTWYGKRKGNGMKAIDKYGNLPDDEWEILPWIPDPRSPRLVEKESQSAMAN